MTIGGSLQDTLIPLHLTHRSVCQPAAAVKRRTVGDLTDQSGWTRLCKTHTIFSSLSPARAPAYVFVRPVYVCSGPLRSLVRVCSFVIVVVVAVRSVGAALDGLLSNGDFSLKLRCDCGLKVRSLVPDVITNRRLFSLPCRWFAVCRRNLGRWWREKKRHCD